MADIDDNMTVTVEEEEHRRKPEDEVRRRKKRTYKALKNQMEFYFGDANLTKDKFLIDLIEKDKYVDLAIFLRFNKIRALTSNIEDIAKALRDSEILSVTEDGTKVYRTTPIHIKENEEDCTIYVEQLPPDADHEWLRRVFSSYGEVVYVSIPKYKPSNKIKGFAFVEFDTPEAANKTLEAFGAMGCRLPAQMPPDNLCSIATFEQTSEEDKNGEETTMTTETIEKSDSEQPTNQKKRKLENPDSSIDSETGADTGPSRKKKKKKQKSNEGEMTSQEAEKDEVPPSKSTVENAGSGKTVRKRKSRDSNPQMQDADTENETSYAEVDNESESVATEEAKSKKQRQEQETEADSGDECEMKSDDAAEESKDDNTGEERRKKKKNRNRKRKKKVKQENDPSKLGLKILSKREWKRLRNKYLDLQRSKMKAVKQHLARARWASQTPRAYSEDGENHHEVAQQQAVVSSDPPRTVFTPGVIAHVTLDEPLTDVAKFKSDVRGYSDVQYVDILEGTNEAYVRFSTPSSAAHFVQEKPFGSMEILSGDEEMNYWNKIKQDRAEKFSQKIKVKQRGRDKLLKRVERELGKHIRFDE
ncbi:la-related protein 7 [Schistocerca serialis cubense]|uniref:la-related protein 7 n=1 Tax=Schistocerca serialis cubense TaxID=2023355 RepID=UPI00214EDA54|nr:la-related protein 7 [Schistocerca serialis cubense]